MYGVLEFWRGFWERVVGWLLVDSFLPLLPSLFRSILPRKRFIGSDGKYIVDTCEWHGFQNLKYFKST